MTAKITDLEGRLDAAMKRASKRTDKQRLDYMNRKGQAAFCDREWNWTYRGIEKFPTLRAAIDAAMDAEG